MAKPSTKKKIKRAAKVEQLTFIPSSSSPMWTKVKGHLKSLPRGWQNDLGKTLCMGKSGVSLLISRDKEPRISVYHACLDFLKERGVEL